MLPLPKGASNYELILLLNTCFCDPINDQHALVPLTISTLFPQYSLKEMKKVCEMTIYV